MDIFDKYPELKNVLEKLLKTRRNEILTDMLESDDEYMELVHNRTKASMLLKNMLADPQTDVLFEEYSDAIYSQEVYELDTIYKQAFIDAIVVLQNQGLL